MSLDIDFPLLDIIINCGSPANHGITDSDIVPDEEDSDSSDNCDK
jgi:hypothetical protein